ncbi:MAG: peptidylprolyl isomerase [DPANN group archaeon]|nr:peptidylprolyl isomerase [DPANN group archaeon]
MADIMRQGDMLEFDFVGRIKTSGQIFDLSSEEAAKKEGIYQQGQKYGPAVAVIGKGMLIKGLEKNLEGKEIGKEYDFEVSAEEAFGQRNPQLVQLTNLSKFKEFRPVPGMQVNVDGIIATVRSVSGGRVTLDFNHPLAGKALVYHVKILRKISDLSGKIKIICEKFLGLKAEVKAVGKKVTVKAKTADGKELEKGAEARLAGEIKKLLELKDTEVVFEKIQA